MDGNFELPGGPTDEGSDASVSTASGGVAPEAPPAKLIDDSDPMSPAALLQYLQSMGIEVVTARHAPVFTVEEAKGKRGSMPGCHTKNLFLRNKKKRMWLVVCEQNRKVDLRALGDTLGAGRLSFGSPRRLMERLGVAPGSVTPFAIVNDVEGAVTVVLERVMLDQDPLNFHPLDNSMTTAIAAKDLLRFLEAENHSPTLVDFHDGGR